MKRIGIVKDDLFLKHTNGPQHPECPARLESINTMLDSSGLISKLEVLDPVDATEEQILRTHTESYFETVKNTKGVEVYKFDPDTSSNPFTYDAAMRGSGGFISSIDKVLNGEINYSFAFPRPPGHHAEADRAMGFCFFNHVAVAAAHLLSKGLDRVLVIDWDIHHGNGTQHIFYDNPNVLYFSIHQFPFYPGTGSLDEYGKDEGEGYNVNFPIPPMLGDTDYNKLFELLLTPVIEQYKPEFILVSAGFDAYFVDPLGNMQITEQGFAQLTRYVMNAADKHCAGKLSLVLEGGYNIMGLASITKLVIEELMDINKTEIVLPEDFRNLEFVIEGILGTYSKFWKFS